MATDSSMCWRLLFMKEIMCNFPIDCHWAIRKVYSAPMYFKSTIFLRKIVSPSRYSFWIFSHKGSRNLGLWPLFQPLVVNIAKGVRMSGGWGLVHGGNKVLGASLSKVCSHRYHLLKGKSHYLVDQIVNCFTLLCSSISQYWYFTSYVCFLSSPKTNCVFSYFLFAAGQIFTFSTIYHHRWSRKLVQTAWSSFLSQQKHEEKSGSE